MAEQETAKPDGTTMVDGIETIKAEYHKSGFYWGEPDWINRAGKQRSRQCLANPMKADAETGPAIVEERSR